MKPLNKNQIKELKNSSPLLWNKYKEIVTKKIKGCGMGKPRDFDVYAEIPLYDIKLSYDEINSIINYYELDNTGYYLDLINRLKNVKYHDYVYEAKESLRKEWGIKLVSKGDKK